MHLIQTEARGGHRGRRGGGIWGTAGRPSERPELIKVISLENGEPNESQEAFKTRKNASPRLTITLTQTDAGHEPSYKQLDPAEKPLLTKQLWSRNNGITSSKPPPPKSVFQKPGQCAGIFRRKRLTPPHWQIRSRRFYR